MIIYFVKPDFRILSESIERFKCVLHVLLSFAHVDRSFSTYLHAYRKKIGRIMADSGAYTEMEGGRVIDLNSYISWLRVVRPLFDFCINLDVEPDNYNVRMWNLAKIEEAGIDALPVVHDPYAGEIDQLYDMGYTYILIGSTWGNDRKQLDFIFNRYYYSGRYPEIRFHKLGSALYSTLAGYPFFSSDSATYAHDAGFGNVLFWNDHREPDSDGDRTDTIYFGGQERAMLNDEHIYYEYPYLGEFEDYLWKTFEYRLTDLLGSEESIERRIVIVKYTLDLQERMTRLHGV